MPISEVYNKDCVEYMKDVPDGFFDIAIVDIEYGIGASKPSIKPCIVTQKNGDTLSVKQPNYINKLWDFKMSGDEYFNQLFRCSKKQIVFGGNYYGLKGGYLVWDKLNGESDQYGCELAWLSFTKRTDMVYYMWAGMFQGAYCGKDIKKAIRQQGNKELNEARIHPTQKPVILYEWIIMNYASNGDRILDTHMGSQSNRIAAYNNGFDFYGCEIDKDYFDDGNNRFEMFKQKLKLF